MGSNEHLLLHEEVMLLALRDEKGTVDSDTHYQYAIAGGILAELLLGNRITTDGSKKRQVIIQNNTSIGDSLIDECMKKIQDARKPKSLQSWLEKFADLKDLHHRVATSLCQRGILHAEEDKILLLFSRTLYPEFDPKPEQLLHQRLRDAVMGDNPDVDHRTAMLLSLSKATNLLNVVFTKQEQKQRKSRIEEIVNGNTLGKAAKEAVEAMETTIMIACLIAVM